MLTEYYVEVPEGNQTVSRTKGKHGALSAPCARILVRG